MVLVFYLFCYIYDFLGRIEIIIFVYLYTIYISEKKCHQYFQTISSFPIPNLPFLRPDPVYFVSNSCFELRKTKIAYCVPFAILFHLIFPCLHIIGMICILTDENGENSCTLITTEDQLKNRIPDNYHFEKITNP